MNEKVREQILAIRDTGLTNMFDVHMVLKLALDRGYYDLVNYLELVRILKDTREEYVNFILTGKTE